MTDNIIENETLPTAPVPTTSVIDTAPAPIETPVVETPVVETPVVETPVEPAEEKPFVHTDTPSLLAGETPAEAVTEGEAPAAAETPAAKQSASQSDAAAETPVAAEPIKYEFQLPEGVTIDDARMTGFQELLNKHHVPTEGAQELVDLYMQERQADAQRSFEDQHRAFADTRKGWVNEVMADPEIGGAGHQTAMSQIFRMRDLFVAERDNKAFNDFLDATGAGDHPAFLRFIYRVAQKFDEARPAPQPSAPAPSSKADQRRKLLYDHPESQT